VFSDNVAGSGGGVFLDGSGTPRQQLVNVLFAHNRATGNGAAIDVGFNPQVHLIQVTIVSPTVPSGAAEAVYVGGGATVYITNSLVASTTVGIRRSSGTVLENYNLFDNVTTPYTGGVTSGGNSVTGTVAFYDTTYYTLTAASAAIDQGTNAGVTSDYFGSPRPHGLGYDIGYAESPYASHYTLTVAMSGAGSGVITPTAGVYTYTYGTVVTLTASANLGSTFTGWGGDCNGTGSCVVTMTSAQSVSATFDVISYKIYGPFIRK
jgi:hypothetical protein